MSSEESEGDRHYSRWRDTFTGYFLSARGRGYGVEESLKKLQLRQERQLREKELLYLFPVGKNWKKKRV